jgi:hypothetical protein
MTWCSINCPEGERRIIKDLPVLWCRVSDCMVIDLPKCPRGHWVRNEDGRPVDTPGEREA